MSTTISLEQYLECLGGPLPSFEGQASHVIESWPADGYRLELVRYESEPGELVPAYLLVPDGVSPDSPAPAVTVFHQHGGQYDIGKGEPAGLLGNPEHHTGAWLARQGYVVLCADAVAFEQRKQGRRVAGADLERFMFLHYVVRGSCLAWKNILDIVRGVDYLVSRPEVDPDRIGSYGHSMGSTHAFLSAPLEPRIRAVVCNCCLPGYRGIHRDELLHCYPNFIPGLARIGDLVDVPELIAPRPLLINAGTDDVGSPIDEVRRKVGQLRELYREMGAPEHLVYNEEPTGHRFTDTMKEATRVFFETHL